MHPRADHRHDPGSSVLRRWGPVSVVTAVVGAVAVAGVVGGDGDGTAAPTTAPRPVERPAGAITWSMAEEAGLDVTFPPSCDTSTGMVAIPFLFRTECFADAPSAGATAPGVTADTIKVVAWIPAEDDPLRALVLQRIGFDATNAELREVYTGLAEVFGATYQTYGRRVELDFVEASGSILDPTATRADAVRAAEDLGAFAVLGGPLIGTGWTEELHARGVVCVGCPGIADPEPTVFSVPPTNGQLRAHLVAYVAARLAGRPAEHAGDGIAGRPRVFGHLALGMGTGDERGADRLGEQLAEAGVELAEQVLYPLDPGRAAELATGAVSRMQEAGVTTVLVQADPVLLPSFTQEATKQGWFPEWVLGGSPFIDTTAFGRTFDQQQWAHAFGISYFPPQVAPAADPPHRLYEWFHGEAPPVSGSLPLLLVHPQVTLFFTGLEHAGPVLTAETFRDGLFTMPPTPRSVTQPSVSYGEHRWDGPDHAGIDDLVELWWDPAAEGTDEAGVEGTGMYRYVDGGRRHLADEWEGEPRAFVREGSVTVIEDVPDEERPPDYPSPAGG